MKERELKDRLARYRQTKLRVIGRKSGKTISIPSCSILHHLMTFLFSSRHFLWRWHGECFARTRGQGSQALLKYRLVNWELLTTCACRLPLRRRSPWLGGIMDHQDQ